MQHGLLYLSIYTHRFAVPEMLDTGAMQSFVSHKLAAKLPAIVQTMMPLTCNVTYGEDNGCHNSYPIGYAD